MSTSRRKHLAWQRAGMLMLVVASVALGGCGSNGGPTGPEFDDLWVRGYYAWLPDRAGRDGWVTCSVEIRDGEGGSIVDDLDVRCNGVRLTLSDITYTGDPGDIPPGDLVTFTISDGAHSVSATLEVPDPPTGLSLQEGEWDFSDSLGSHTLTWTNPSQVADTLVIDLVGHFLYPWILATHEVEVPPSATSVTIPTADMSDFQGATSVNCAVFQGRRGEFADHSGASVLWARAAATASWGARHLTSACSRQPGAVTRAAIRFAGSARAIAGCG